MSSVPPQPAHVVQASCAIALALRMGPSGPGSPGLLQGICQRGMLSAKPMRAIIGLSRTALSLSLDSKLVVVRRSCAYDVMEGTGNCKS